MVSDLAYWSDFSYDLPDELIAQRPLSARSASRLLCLPREGGELTHSMMRKLPELLNAGDALVFNDTRVLPARLQARKSSGGRVEILLERIESERSALAIARPAKRLIAGSELRLERAPEHILLVTGRIGELLRIQCAEGKYIEHIFESAGETPLPPYIARPADETDIERYQTVYASQAGAVAAPTAGLHFDEQLLADLDHRRIERVTVTLHIGLGTFQPPRGQRLAEHRMHSERATVSEAACAVLCRVRQRGGRIVAVGTSAARALESAASRGMDRGVPRPWSGETALFISPGYRFACIDGLLTNFHQPCSSLLALVCAFAGRKSILAAYREAVSQGYRFLSYGDAMLILAAPKTKSMPRPG